MTALRVFAGPVVTDGAGLGLVPAGGLFHSTRANRRLMAAALRSAPLRSLALIFVCVQRYDADYGMAAFPLCFQANKESSWCPAWSAERP